MITADVVIGMGEYVGICAGLVIAGALMGFRLCEAIERDRRER